MACTEQALSEGASEAARSAAMASHSNCESQAAGWDELSDGGGSLVAAWERCPVGDSPLGVCGYASDGVEGLTTNVYYYENDEDERSTRGQVLAAEFDCLNIGNVASVGFTRAEGHGQAPSDSQPLRGVVSASAALSVTCAALDDGSVRCWGENLGGVLGLPRDEWEGVPVPQPQVIEGVEDAVMVAAGLGSACAVTGTGAVYCWGDGAAQDNTSEVRRVDGLPPMASVTADDYKGWCGVAEDGTGWCWDDRGRVTSIGGAENIAIWVEDGWDWLWLLTDGSVLRAADKDLASAPPPEPLPALEGATQLTEGPCGLVGSEVRCIDANGEVEAVELPGAVVELAAGMALLDNGEVYRLGDVREPVAMLDPSAMSLAPGHFQGCAILEDTTLMCWGGNYSGERGSYVPSDSPPSLVLE